MLEYFIKTSLLIYVMEIGAAVAGVFYLRRTRDAKSELKLFVYFLWLTVFVETVGLYPTYAYFNDYTTFWFIKDTPFERNYWWYNCYSIIKFLVYFVFFTVQLRSRIRRRIFFVSSILFAVSAILNLAFSGVFFVASSSYTSILGTLILCILVMCYFYEMLQSDKLLNFYKQMSFYVAVGVLVWHLVATPLFIYSQYFTLKSPDFVWLYHWVLRISNLYLYVVFILGFILTSGKRSGSLS